MKPYYKVKGVNIMSLEDKLKSICKENSDVEIEEIDLNEMFVDVLFPYESAAVTITLEGNDDEEIVQSFIVGVNQRLNDMIDHLNDCKLDE